VDTDQRSQAPGLVLTSMTKHVDVAVFETIRSWSEGRFTGGVKAFGLKENGVGFVYDRHNRNLVTEEIYRKTLALKEKIVSGELSVPAVIQEKRMFSRAELLDVLAQVHHETAMVLGRLDADLARSAERLAGENLNAAMPRRAQGALPDPPLHHRLWYGERPGTMVAVEPAAHRDRKGQTSAGRRTW
jgi:hypothetical protein